MPPADHPADRPVDSGRFDPLTPAHKALRQLMFDVLGQVGALDASDIFEVDFCTQQVARLARVLPAAAVLCEPLLKALHQRDAGGRNAAAIALYQALSRFVSEQLVTQLRLEREQLPLLHTRHTDPELRAARRQQLSALSEAELADMLGAMAPASTPQELAAFVDDLQTSVDPQTFACLLDALRRQAGSRRWQRIARELGLPDGGLTTAGRRASAAFAGRGDDIGKATPPRRTSRVDRFRLRLQ